MVAGAAVDTQLIGTTVYLYEAYCEGQDELAVIDTDYIYLANGSLY